MLSMRPIAPPRRTPGTTRLGLFVGAIPLFMLMLYQWLATPTFFGSLGNRRPEFLGIPIALWIVTVALLWGAIGGYIVARSRSRWALPFGLLLFTIPACLAMLLGPALVLILQNLGS